MVKKLFISILLIFSALASVVQAEEYNINPGMWETTMKMEVTGMPPEMAAMMQKPAKTEKECIKDKNYKFDPGEETPGCTVNSKRVSSKKMTWEVICNQEAGNASGKGEVNFKGNTVSGWFEMNMQGPGGPMKIRNSFEGKRIGSC